MQTVVLDEVLEAVLGLWVCIKRFTEKTLGVMTCIRLLSTH